MIDVKGISYIEFAAPYDNFYKKLFQTLGFEKIALAARPCIEYADLILHNYSGEIYKQNDITFIVYAKEFSFSREFYEKHGPSVSSFSFAVDNPVTALKEAIKLGCKNVSPRSYLHAIEGVGESKIFLTKSTPPASNKGVGLKYIDHLTNNVYPGNMGKWSKFYETVFGFRLLKYFDIDGQQTGLVSRAMGKDIIAIPINEDKSDKGQIAEYLRKYNGEGVQHIALLTDDIYDSVEKLRKNGIEFLDIPDTYYEMIDERIPNHNEDLERMKKNKILIDGEEGSILLQIFTKTVIGPVFFEIIQRKNNKLFGDGNFAALFRAIEEDQVQRGVL